MRHSNVLAGLLVSLVAAGCSGTPDEPNTGEHHYTIDLSQYSALADPPSLFVANENLALPLEARSQKLTADSPGSLDTVYTRSYCGAGQLPIELPAWGSAQIADVPAVHLTQVSVTLVDDGNDLTRIPSFSIRSQDGTWSGCTVAPSLAENGAARTASLHVDVPAATALAIFPDTYAHIVRIDYTTRD
jgi:hypothetical protein